MDLSKIKGKFARKAIKEVAQQIVDSMPEAPEEETKEETTMTELGTDEFISKRDMVFLLAGVFTGYLLFHNSLRIKDLRRF